MSGLTRDEVIARVEARNAFRTMLRKLREESRPENRVVSHLLQADMHDTWTFAYLNPDALSISDAA